MRVLLASLLGALVLVGHTSARPDLEASAVCQATAPNGRTPPGERPGATRHGSRGLFVALYYPRLVARRVEPDGSVWEKFPWWADGPTALLEISGRRLDRAAPPLQARVQPGWPANPQPFRGTAFWSSAIRFPTAGCWSVTGRSGRASLTFVVQVVKRAK